MTCQSAYQPALNKFSKSISLFGFVAVPLNSAVVDGSPVLSQLWSVRVGDIVIATSSAMSVLQLALSRNDCRVGAVIMNY